MEEADARRNIGRRLGEFVLCELIGEGGFGSVFRAEQPGLDREAVVKILRARLRDEPRAAQRFMREARLAARLDHPYAAHIYAYGAELDGVLWIAMEFVRGTSLAEVLREHGVIPVSRAVPFFERLCEVVHSAHEQGIVHRDIKPHNVMVVSRAGRLLPKLLDLGIAKLVDNAYRAPGGAGGDEVVELPADTSVSETTAPERGAVVPASRVAPARPWLETERGALIGTPAYMAPELWRGEAADARTDIYALGVLAYEMLAGRRPFDAEVLADLSSGHLSDRVPPIGGDVPAALDDVIGRALAKERDARFATALELGAALRAASELPGVEPDWPRLEEVAVDAWSRDAPRPIAEAFVLYEAARNLHQARDALCGLVRTLVRTAAILALACRNRVGPRPGDEPARAMLDELRRGELDDASWVELARLLAAPFAGRVEAHPMPELITALTAEPPDGLAELAADCEAHRGPATEPALRELLARSLPRLGRQLRRFAFLCDYQLCAGVEGGAVIWRGARAAPPAPVALEPGRAAVLDAQGGLVTTLSPLAEVARPAPGLPEALFLFAGRGRFGARLVAYPQEFERHEAGLWAEADDGATPRFDDAPYRGLAAFSAADAGSFVGREREVVQLGNRLRVEPLLLVVGPSGAGKSSFVHAGVIPTLEDWHVIVVRPGPSPMAALEARLAPRRGADGLLPAKTVLVVDQLEEIFTLCADPEEREAFAAALAGAGSLARGSRVIATLRDDFLSSLERLAGLRERIAPAIQLLATPAPDDLVRIVVEPARRRGHQLDAGLAEEMVEEVADQPGALALLSFTAARLWERRDRELRRLTRKAYVELGGVGGALAQHAEEVLAGMTAEEARVVRDAFQQLLTSAGTRAVLTHAELVRSLASPRAERVIDRLVAARLLVTSQSEDGHDRVEIIHEALLTAWPRLASWRQEDAAATRLRLALREAARQWDMRGRARGLLWRDDALAEYRLWRARHPVSLTEIEDAFAGASLAEAARGRRARLTLLASAFAALAAVVIVLSTLYRQAQQARRAEAESAALARRTVALQYEEQGRLALLGGDHFAALAYLLEAHERGVDGRALRFMLGKASQVLDKQVAVLSGHGDRVRTAAFLPDGKRVLTSSTDNTLRLWDPPAPASITMPVDAPLNAAVLSPDGSRAVSFGMRGPALLWDMARGARVAALDDTERTWPGARFAPGGAELVTFGGAAAWVWRAADGARLARLAPGSGTVVEAALLAGGQRAITASSAGAIQVWTLPDAMPRLLATLPATLASGALSPDEQVVAAGGLDGYLSLVRVADGVVIARQRCHGPGVWSVTFSPDGKRVMTTGQETAARIWDAATGGFLFSLEDGAEVAAARFSPDGERAITMGASRTIGVWSARTGKLLSRLVGHTESVRDAGFSPDGARLVSAAADRTARIWNPRADDLIAQVTHPRPVFFAALDARGRVVTSSQDGLMRVWEGGRVVASQRTYQPLATDEGDDARAVALSEDGRLLAAAEGDRARVFRLDGGERLLDLGPHEGRVWSVAFDGAATRVATTDDRAARLWDLASGNLLATYTGHSGPVVYAAFDPGGGRLVTASEDDTARVWDLRSPAVVVLTGHRRDLSSAVFSPDGRRVITSSLDTSVKLWDAASGAEIRSLLGHRGGATHAEMSRDGAWIVSSSMDGTAKLWDADSGKLLYSFDLHAGKVWSAHLDTDGRRLITASSDGTAATWDLGAPPEPAAIAAAGACRIPVRVDGGRLVPAPACP